MAKKPIIRQSGITIDGKQVMSGVFALKGTRGIPLENILVLFNRRNWVIDWLDYITDAHKDGANLRNIIANILNATQEVFGKEYSNKIGGLIKCSLLAKNTVV